MRVGALLLLAAGCSLFPASAQTRTVEILNADLVEVRVEDGRVVRRLVGNVRMRQDTTLLTAREAVYDETAGLARLTGGVRIVSGRDTLTADAVVYDQNARTAAASGRVRVGDGEAVLTAPRATYDTQAETSAFDGGGRLAHRGAVLTSPAGTYNSATRRATFSGPLVLADSASVLRAARGLYDARIQRADAAGAVVLDRLEPTGPLRLTADSLVYFRRTERARAYGSVILDRAERLGGRADSLRRTVLLAETLLYDGQAETAQARGTRPPLSAVLSPREGGGTDTTLVRAPRLDAARRISGADTTQVVTAAGGAQLWSRRLAALADSAHVARARAQGDRLDLLGSTRPRAWADGAQLTGDSLRLELSPGGRAERLLVTGRAHTARLDSTLGRLAQLAGGQMRATFRDDRIHRLDVWPAAEALVYRADGSTPARLAGADRLSADSLVVRFDGDEIREVSGIGGVEGTTFGPRSVPDDVRLPGFAYDPADAPTRASVLPPDGPDAAALARAADPPAGPDPRLLVRPGRVRVAPRPLADP